MDSLLAKAAALWSFDGGSCVLIAERENRVFKVTCGGQHFALRIHRAGLRSDAELRSELNWMAELARSGMRVPTPIPSTAGVFLHRLEGHQVDMLTWLTGAPLGATSEPLQHPDRTGLFRQLGKTLARLHLVSDTWTPPTDFARIDWNQSALVGEDPLWGRFWENPELTASEIRTLQTFRQAANEDLSRRETMLDHGLIHADAVRENIMVDGEDLYLIDFDDCGYGYRLFDVATALIKNMSEPDYPELRDALLHGYQELRSLDIEALDLFMALRAVTYVGWNIVRLDEPGGRVRNSRMIAQATSLAEAYLSTRNGTHTHTLEVSR